MIDFGTGLSAFGKLIGGIGAYQTGKYNAGVAELNAVQEERDGAAQELRVREAARAALGQQAAALGANGLLGDTGSAIDLLAESQVNAAMDAMTVRRQAASAARARRVQGANAMAEGRAGLMAGLFGAGSTLASGASDWATARAGTSGGTSGSGGYGGSKSPTSIVVTPGTRMPPNWGRY